MRKLLFASASAAALVSAACATTPQEGRDMTQDPSATTTAAAPAAPAAPAVANPLLAQWKGPYGGVPAFDQVKVEHFKPALEGAMNEARAQIATIANTPAAPTFENTLVALEDTARTLDAVGTFYGVWASTMNSPDFQAIEREMAPKLAAFSDEITQNEKLFQRIEAVY